MVSKKNIIWVGDLGNAELNKKGKIIVYYVREEDGTKSWQLSPDTNRGDKILKVAKVIPLDPETISEIRKQLRNTYMR